MSKSGSIHPLKLFLVCHPHLAENVVSPALCNAYVVYSNLATFLLSDLYQLPTIADLLSTQLKTIKKVVHLNY